MRRDWGVTAEINGFYARGLAVGSGAAFEEDWDRRI